MLLNLAKLFRPVFPNAGSHSVAGMPSMKKKNGKIFDENKIERKRIARVKIMNCGTVIFGRRAEGVIYFQ